MCPISKNRSLSGFLTNYYFWTDTLTTLQLKRDPVVTISSFAAATSSHTVNYVVLSVFKSGGDVGGGEAGESERGFELGILTAVSTKQMTTIFFSRSEPSGPH